MRDRESVTQFEWRFLVPDFLSPSAQASRRGQEAGILLTHVRFDRNLDEKASPMANRQHDTVCPSVLVRWLCPNKQTCAQAHDTESLCQKPTSMNVNQPSICSPTGFVPISERLRKGDRSASISAPLRQLGLLGCGHQTRPLRHCHRCVC